MRVVCMQGKILELNYMWLPTFIGQNMWLMGKMQDEWKEVYGKYRGQLMPTAMVLDQMHNWAIEWLCKELPIPGLEDYLRAIEKVPMEGNDVAKPIDPQAG